MNEKKFSRHCPNCNTTLFYTGKKHMLLAEKKQTLCRTCTVPKNAKPKEEFCCFTCGKKWMDWRSQISNPEMPFCSKQCWYDSETKSLIGQRFGNLLVIARERRDQTTFYSCLCNCGTSTEVTHTNLYEGTTSSCGCLISTTRKSERKPLDEVVAKSIWNTYKRNAKNRNYEWSLPYDQFLELIKGDCYYCDQARSNVHTWRYKYETATMAYNGIDRLDNAIGYTAANCVSCCRTCNSAKGESTIDDFKEWALRLASKFQK